MIVYAILLPELHVLLVAISLQGKHAEAVESLLTLEKQSRLSEDITSTKMCCKAILEVLYNAKDWQQLNEHILLLAKRRSQLKQVSNASDHCVGMLTAQVSWLTITPFGYHKVWRRLFKHLFVRQWTMLRRPQTKQQRLN